MTPAQPSSQRSPRIRFHLSEELAAELSFLLREGPHRSWEELFRAMLLRFRERLTPLPDPRLIAEARQIARETMAEILEEIRPALKALHAFAETQAEESHATHADLERLNGQLQRLIGLLELAMNVREEPPPRVPPRIPPVPGESRGDEVLRRIRNRQF